ncbi:MAG: tetraacyldisaccharide 4'-kinase [Gammaproteobacteria bacterium]|nr:tetraacyldisaccharide 4'-kinase [Gammaproteobacteria bacterium]
MLAVERHWNRITPVSLALLPLSLLFCLLVLLRRIAYRLELLHSARLARPVIVVGNITVGGTGKTPLTIWLASFLREQGYRPGIVTRGYRGKSDSWPIAVTASTSPDIAGDEAVLLARRTRCPVLAGPDRVESCRHLIGLGCDVIISDDGLQHYRLRRDIEIAVIDGVRRLGNGLCLPGGPLREPASRLQSVDLAIINGSPEPDEIGMSLGIGIFYSLPDPKQEISLSDLKKGRVHAVAGIGHPERFFTTLRNLGLDIVPHAFPDHHAFRDTDLPADGLPVILTEKDAVKCETFAKPNHWVVAVNAEPAPEFGKLILQLLKEKKCG